VYRVFISPCPSAPHISHQIPTVARLECNKTACCVTGEKGQSTTGVEDANEGGSNVVVIQLWEGAML
jgi:hypothetical protein